MQCMRMRTGTKNAHGHAECASRVANLTHKGGPEQLESDDSSGLEEALLAFRRAHLPQQRATLTLRHVSACKASFGNGLRRRTFETAPMTVRTGNGSSSVIKA